MKRVIPSPPQSSFLSCEKDCEAILKKLFLDNGHYSDELKRLIVINTKDCLDNTTSQVYKDILEKTTLSVMREEGFIRLEPKIPRAEHDEIKSYILMSFDNFYTNSKNPQFRNCTVNFDILCHTDCWDIGNFRCRPLKIAGYIDGLLNNQKFSGIGTLHFSACKELILDEVLSGYTLSYSAIHGSDDVIKEEDDSGVFVLNE